MTWHTTVFPCKLSNFGRKKYTTSVSPKKNAEIDKSVANVLYWIFSLSSFSLSKHTNVLIWKGFFGHGGNTTIQLLPQCCLHHHPWSRKNPHSIHYLWKIFQTWIGKDFHQCRYENVNHRPPHSHDTFHNSCAWEFHILLKRKKECHWFLFIHP